MAFFGEVGKSLFLAPERTYTSYDEMLESIKKNTRHYAKRQLTWFHKDPRIRWIDISDDSDLNQIATGIVKTFQEHIQRT